jgi:hypothetical protein
MSPVRSVLVPEAPGSTEIGQRGVTRRGVVGRAIGMGAGAALAVGAMPRWAGGQEATPVPAGGTSTIETTSGQAV